MIKKSDLKRYFFDLRELGDTSTTGMMTVPPDWLSLLQIQWYLVMFPGFAVLTVIVYL